MSDLNELWLWKKPADACYWQRANKDTQEQKQIVLHDFYRGECTFVNQEWEKGCDLHKFPNFRERLNIGWETWRSNHQRFRHKNYWIFGRKLDGLTFVQRSDSVHWAVENLSLNKIPTFSEQSFPNIRTKSDKC